MQLGSIYVTVKAATDEAVKGIRSFKSVAEKEASNIRKAINRIEFKHVAIAAAAASAAAGLIAKKSIESARDLQETISKSNQVFRQSADDILNWSKKSATAMGMSQQAALENAATMGNMFDQLGAGTKIAADNSKNMVQLAADLASFHNVAGGANEVLNAMMSAFRGEYDALQRYIPTIKAASVQQVALQQTGKASAKELTELEKATAAMTIIMDDAGVATGDFARTSEGLANQQRILSANVQNLYAQIGERLTPVVAEIYQAINKWVENNRDLIDTKINEYVDKFAEYIKTAKEKVDDFKPVLETLVTVAKDVAAAFKWAGETIGNAAGAISIFMENAAAGIQTMQAYGVSSSGAIIPKATGTGGAGVAGGGKPKEPAEIITEQNKVTQNAVKNNEVIIKSIGQVTDVDIASIIKVQNAKDKARKDEAEITKEKMNDEAKLAYIKDQYYIMDMDRSKESITQAQVESQKKLAIWEQTYYGMEYVNNSTYNAMQNTISSFGRDFLHGELKSWQDYFKSFMDSVLQAWINMLAEMVAQWLAKKAIMTFGDLLGNVPVVGNIVSGISSALGLTGATAAGASTAGSGAIGAGSIGTGALTVYETAALGTAGSTAGGIAGAGGTAGLSSATISGSGSASAGAGATAALQGAALLAIPAIVGMITSGESFSDLLSGVSTGKSYQAYLSNPIPLTAGQYEAYCAMHPDQCYASGTGFRGLPKTGTFIGHEGEIVLNREESQQMRQGGTPVSLSLVLNNSVITTKDTKSWLAGVMEDIRREKYGRTYESKNLVTAGIDI